jgi:hypothetical protein
VRSTVATRLAAFTLVIAGSFGTAYGLGQKLPGNRESKPHTHGSPAASPIPPGFSVDGYVLVTEANQPSTSALALHINGSDGGRITNFVDDHGAMLHVVLIRPDLSGFQHVHPDVAADGSFVIPIDQPGKWHVIVESQPAGAQAPIALATNVDDEVAVGTVSMPGAVDAVTLDDLTVSRNGLDFAVVSKDGSAVTGLEPYLGQPAHLIAIREGDLAYTHLHSAHAMAGSTFTFDGTLGAGTYRLFLQFGYRGSVETFAFTVVQP